MATRKTKGTTESSDVVITEAVEVKPEKATIKKKKTIKKETNTEEVKPKKRASKKSTKSETIDNVIEFPAELKSVDTTEIESAITPELLDSMVDAMNAQTEIDSFLDTMPMPTMVEPSVTLINEPNPFKRIETAGRTCYKSEGNITKNSAISFVSKLIENNHTAMIEHASVAFQMDCDEGCEPILLDYIIYIQKQHYLHVTIEPSIPRIMISGNIRAILQRNIMDPITRSLLAKYPEFSPMVDTSKEPTHVQVRADIKDLRKIEDLTRDEFMNHFHITARFITDRGVSHELVRHRLFSFAQESTRYCNYSKNKFGNHVTFCKPSTYEDWTPDQQDILNTTLSTLDSVYQALVSGDDALAPQQVRAILPSCTKTEIVVSGPGFEWKYFFALRSEGVTGPPHPDMKYIADIALQKINKYLRTLKYKTTIQF